MGDASRRPEVSRDARLGKLALEWGWISPLQLKEALTEQEADTPRRPLGRVLVDRSVLSENQLRQLLEKISPATPSFPPFGKYELVREIGRGAMGVVYEAEDSEPHRRVALKMLISPPRQNLDEAKPEEDRFLRETQLHKSLPPHPGIVPVLEAGVIEGRRYLAMELVDGASMGAWCRTGSITIRQRVALLRDVALAVHHAHRHGIVHRDLKPENILVDKNHQPRITDFGLAKMLGSAVQPLATATGTALGTPAYMSPEQVRGEKDISARSDVFSLGVMLYELLTGRRPFEGETAYEIMMKTVNDEAVAPSRISNLQINPVLYANLENICMIALAKNPKDRYPDAAGFARDLGSWLKGEDVRVIVPKNWRIWRARKLVLRIALAATLVAGGVGGYIAFHGRGQPPKAPVALPPISLGALQPGCIAEFYAGMNHNALGLRKIDTRAVFDDPSQPLWPEAQGGWTSRRWTGYIQVPVSGTWIVEVKSVETAHFIIGDTEIYEGMGPRSRPVQLKAGIHRFLLEHGHGSPNDTVAISWTPPGSAVAEKLGPGSFYHAMKDYQGVQPQPGFRNALPPVPGAEEGERLPVLADSGHPPQRKGYAYYSSYWKGNWSGAEHLWWGPGVKEGDKLRLRFSAGETGRGTIALGLTHASDHGIFKVSVNGAVIAESLDLFSDDMETRETEFKNVELKAGPNDLEFEVVGTNPAAREWGFNAGLFKLGLDYVLVR